MWSVNKLNSFPIWWGRRMIADARWLGQGAVLTIRLLEWWREQTYIVPHIQYGEHHASVILSEIIHDTTNPTQNGWELLKVRSTFKPREYTWLTTWRHSTKKKKQLRDFNGSVLEDYGPQIFSHQKKQLLHFGNHVPRLSTVHTFKLQEGKRKSSGSLMECYRLSHIHVELDVWEEHGDSGVDFSNAFLLIEVRYWVT